MKRILLTMLLVVTVMFANSQTTYYWVGGAGATSFTANTNWNTLLNGSGSVRTAAANDILIFDGSNIGGAVPATGSVIATVTSTAFGQLRLQNGANVNIGRSSAGSATLTMNGDGSPIADLSVDAGCTLTLGSAITNYDVNIVVTATATASISGTVYLSPLSTTVHTRSFITAAAANSVTFETGSVCHISDSFTTSGFNASVANSILFKAGSSLYYYTGRSPIGSSSTTQFTNFETGSNLYFMQSNISYIDGTTAYGSSSWVNQKILANVFIKNGSTIRADGPVYKIENFTIDNGCTFTTHTSGNTAVLGNLVVNGTLSGPAAASSNIVVMGGNSPQSISGSGVIDVPSITVANHSDVTLAKSLSVVNAANIYGKVNFAATNQISGPGTFTSRVDATAVSLTGNTVAGSYVVTGVTGTIAGVVGLKIEGAGIAPNTNIVGFATGTSTLNLSKPATTTTTGSTFTFKSDTAILVTANTNGMDSLTGSVIVVGTKNFQSGTSYVINGATTWPFGVTSGSTSAFINAAFVEVNAPITVNRKVNISNHLTVNGKITLSPLDTIHISSGGFIDGTFNSSNYIATGYNPAGEQSILQYDGLTTTTTLPIGTTNYYMPVTINPVNSSDFTVAVYEGITTNGTITGTAFTPTQKQTVVNAAWSINRLNGTGDASLQLGWDAALEGSTFTTLPGTDIGLITNNGSIWANPIGIGDNTANNVTATVSSFGSFGAGAVPQVNPFVFNALPTKTYGDVDFNGGATSLNTTQPIVYSSDNTAVATIVGGLIHITGAGTANITASQASDGFYPAASVTKPLTVSKATLEIKADNKVKFEGVANPPLTITYTSFVYGETPAALLTPVVISTTAVTGSTPGVYPITVSGATSNNYNITFVNGTLTVQPKQNQTITFAAPATKTYGNADFSAAASSTNNTIPLTYNSSNTAVATINSSGMIHITGAGTSTITVSQAGNDGYFAATPVARTLTVNKVNLTVRVLDTSKVEGTANPVFTTTYTGFVLGETAANLTTQPQPSTSATTNSSAGYYTVTASGGVSQNYNFIYVSGRLTILPLTGTTQQHLNAFLNTNGTLTVRVYSTTPSLGDIVVYDLGGRPVAKRNLYMPVGFIQADLFIPTVATGIYIVTVRGEGVDLKKMVQILK